MVETSCYIVWRCIVWNGKDDKEEGRYGGTEWGAEKKVRERQKERRDKMQRRLNGKE